jgi:hypothetical protein
MKTKPLAGGLKARLTGSSYRRFLSHKPALFMKYFSFVLIAREKRNFVNKAV